MNNTSCMLKMTLKAYELKFRWPQDTLYNGY